MALLGQDNKFFTHPDETLIGEEIPVEGLKNFVEGNTSGQYSYTYNCLKRTAILTTLEGLQWKILAVVDEREIQEESNAMLRTILLIASVLLILAIGTAFAFSNAIIKNIKKLSSTVKLVSLGDFTQRASIKTKDEIGFLGTDLNAMIDSVSSLLQNVNAATDNVLTSASELVDLSDRSRMASREVAQAVDEVAQGATKQAQDSEVSSQIATKMGDNIRQLTENLMEMIEMTKKAGEINASSVQSVEVLRVKNEENNEATLKTEKAILELEKQSKDIGSIVGAISTIAEQTNLLALNAPIEAARAGEHGRGFAVVAEEIRKLAEEIRKLAEESSHAADQIKNIVGSIQTESQHTVQIMQEVKTRAEDQNQAVFAVEDAFKDIYEAITRIQKIIDVVSVDIDVLDHSKIQILDSIASIASISEEAAAASEEVSASMEEQTSIVEEVASSADQLKALAKGLEDNIKKFEIS